MSIKTKVYLYEVLIRFNEGGYVGAHQMMARKVWNDKTGEVLSDTTLPAESVSDKLVADLIGHQTILMGEQITSLIFERDVLAIKLSQAEARLAELEKR